MTRVILVTGHLGFVGKHLTAELDRRKLAWTGIDHRFDPHYPRNGGCAELRFVPLPDNIERVFHLAAQTDAQCTDVMHDFRDNIFATLRVLERYGDKVVFASSSMVNYPTTPYAISKRAGEDYARIYGAAVVRFPNLYGEGGHSVIDKFRVSETCTIYGSGLQRRTFAPVAVAVTTMLSSKPGDFLIVAGKELTVREVAERACKPIEFLPARGNDPLDATQLT